MSKYITLRDGTTYRIEDDAPQDFAIVESTNKPQALIIDGEFYMVGSEPILLEHMPSVIEFIDSGLDDNNEIWVNEVNHD